MSSSGGSLLVIDVGTSGVRVGLVRPDATVEHVRHLPVLPTTPAPGMVEVDATAIATAVTTLACELLDEHGPVAGVGIANQRATTVVWDRSTGVPVAPGIGWQDLRTVGTCLVLQADGIRLAPNMSATKLTHILGALATDRRAKPATLCFGTIDTWVAWTISRGELHVTDATNAAVTGLVHTDRDRVSWDAELLGRLDIPPELLPRIVDSSGVLGPATALPGAPPICGMAGDQQASLVGQGCTRPGLAKATFGTGGMLDLCTGERRGDPQGRGPEGTFSIVTWQRDDTPTWGVEAVMLSAGSCIEWLRDDLGVIPDAASSAEVAAGCPDTGDVWFVPALLGLGTPVWDFGARGTLLGVTRGTGRAELVRSVLEGIAQRGADLLEAAEHDSGVAVDALRVDGGMSANPVFIQALADATGRVIDVAPVLEATTLGAGFLAGMAVGIWADEADVAEAYAPKTRVEPQLDDEGRTRRRTRWLEARDRATRTVPELSGIAF